MSTAPELVVESDVTTEIELEAVEEIGHAHAHGHAHVPGAQARENAPVVRARRHAILLADVDASLASARPR
jgi:hypothetical protein